MNTNTVAAEQLSLNDLKNFLANTYEQKVQFFLQNGTAVPAHFHVTEAGLTTKQFIDCGGTVREQKHVSFQLWAGDDTDHRLSPQKLLSIIDKSAALYTDENLPIEVEYQGETVGRYGLKLASNALVLLPKQTDCLAKEACGVPAEKPRVKLKDLNLATAPVEDGAACTPGSGCC